MAKKKTESAEATPAKKAPAAKKTAAKKEPAPAVEAAAATAKPAAKKTAKTSKPAGPAPVSLIDTGLAAQTAAAMILNRGTAASAPSAGGSQESSSFKSFKEGLNKPSVAGLGGILGTGGGQKKLGNAFGNKQSAGPGSTRNQTFGADVNRAGVPRRTGGG